MRTSLFLAGKYLRPRRNAVSVITVISVIGVTLGVAVLIIVLAVMTGFTDLMKSKLLATQAHFHIRGSRGTVGDPAPLIATAEKAGLKAAGVVQTPVLAQISGKLDTRVVAIGAKAESLKSFMELEKYLKKGNLTLKSGEVIISSDMARRWSVDIGSRILLHAPNKLTSMVKLKDDGGVELDPNRPVYLPGEFTVCGIYSFGKYDFDRAVLFLNDEDAADLAGLPWGFVSMIYGWVPDPFDMDHHMRQLRAGVPAYFNVSSWQEENRQLLGVLQVEKRMMFFLLIFIVLVAAFSIANTLITAVYQKTHEIGILKALGASDGTVLQIFVFQGMLVGIVGAICGTAAGVLVIRFRNDLLRLATRWTGQDLFPKEFYYFNELPAHIIAGDVILIAAMAVVLCTLGAVIPAIRAAKLDPAGALRYE